MATKYWRGVSGGGNGIWKPNSGANDANWSSVNAPTYVVTQAPLVTDAVVFDAGITADLICTTAAGATCASISTTAYAARTLKLGAALTVAGAVSITSSSLDLNEYTLTCGSFTASGTSSRSIAFGNTGFINVTGSGVVFTTVTTTGLTVTGTALIKLTNSTASLCTITTGSTVGVSNLFSFTITSPSLAYPVTLTTGNLFNNIDFTGYTSGTLNASARTIYGNLTLSSTMTIAATTSITTFAGAGTPLINLAGKTLDNPVTFSGTGTYQLLDNMNVGVSGSTSRAVLFNAGNLDLNNKTLTCGTFSTSGTTLTRTLSGGAASTGLIACYGATASTTLVCYILDTSAAPNGLTILNPLTIQPSRGGTVNIRSQKVSLKVDTDIFAGTVSLSSYFKDLIVGNTLNSFSIGSPVDIILFYGSFKAIAARDYLSNIISGNIDFVGTGTAEVTTGSTLSNFSVVIGSFTNMTLWSDITLSNPLLINILNLNNYKLSAPTIALKYLGTGTLSFGTAGSLACTGSSGLICDINFHYIASDPSYYNYPTVTGTPSIAINGGGAAVSADISGLGFTIPPNMTITNSQLTFVGYAQINNLDLQGNISISYPSGHYIAGNCVLGGTVPSLTMSPSTLTTKTLNTNGVITNILLKGDVGAVLSLSGNVVGGNIILRQGTLDLNNKSVTVDSFTLDDTHTNVIWQASLLMKSSLVTLKGSGKTVWDIRQTYTNFTLSAIDATIIINDIYRTGLTIFNGGNCAYGTLSLNSPLATILINGSNSFKNFTRVTPSNEAEIVKFYSGTSNSFNAWNISGTAGNPVAIGSVNAGSPHTLVNLNPTTPFSSDYLNIQDSHATPPNSWYAGVNSSDIGGNTGWFTALVTGVVAALGNFFLMW